MILIKINIKFILNYLKLLVINLQLIEVEFEISWNFGILSFISNKLLVIEFNLW